MLYHGETIIRTICSKTVTHMTLDDPRCQRSDQADFLALKFTHDSNLSGF